MMLTKCPCGSWRFNLVFGLPKTPVGDWYTRCAVLQKLYPLDLYMCRKCGLLQLGKRIKPASIYGKYIYKTQHSPGLDAHFAETYKAISAVAPTGGLAVDIGCNDGTLLKLFQREGRPVVGVDPVPATGFPIVQGYFSKRLAKRISKEFGYSTIITANNVMANVPDLHDFLKGVHWLLEPHGIFVIETLYGSDIVQRGLLDTIHHEHLYYFNAVPLRTILERYGFKIFRIDRINSKGGSIRVFAEREPSHRVDSGLQTIYDRETANNCNEPTYPLRLFYTLLDARENLRRFLRDCKTVWGFGASIGSTTLLYALELDCSALVDDNPERIGLFSPGKVLPVLGPERLKEQPDAVVILAWRYAERIMESHPEYKGRWIVPLPRAIRYGPDTISDGDMVFTNNNGG